MPQEVVQNYARIIDKVANNKKLQIALVTYHFENKSNAETSSFNLLPRLFGVDFESVQTSFSYDEDIPITIFFSKR